MLDLWRYLQCDKLFVPVQKPLILELFLPIV